jgi:enoyl-CoA hydratase
MAAPILLHTEETIATITFNRPERRNAITFDMWNQLQRLLVDLQGDPQVRTIVFRGAGQEAFSAGADISDHTKRGERATAWSLEYVCRTTANR